jgi:DHA2 family multidrug resistance protein-like MFS transporter
MRALQRRSQPGMPKSRWLVLVPLLLGVLGSGLATSMINTALPRIAAGLSVSTGSQAWIVGVYPLALAVSLVPAVRLGDRYGRRRVLLCGLVAVALLNIAAGLAPDGITLIACRAVLGVAGATVLASMVSTVGQTFRGHDLAVANGAWVTVIGAGGAVGPAAGGFLTQAEGWRWVFGSLSLLAVVAAVSAWRLMPDSPARRVRGRWDGAGVVLSAVTVGGMVYGIQRIAPDPFAGGLFLAAGAAAAACFVRRQRRTADPLIDITLFGRPGFARCTTQILVSAATAAACLYLVSLHLQHTLGRTPAEAGLALAPQAAATALGGVLAPLTTRWAAAAAVVRAALAVQAAGLFALAWSGTAVFVPIALVGLGYGAVGTLATTALFETVEPAHSAQAGAIQEIAFAFGGGAGIALFSAVEGIGSRHGFLLAVAAAALLTAASAGIPTRRRRTRSTLAGSSPVGLDTPRDNLGAVVHGCEPGR